MRTIVLVIVVAIECKYTIAWWETDIWDNVMFMQCDDELVAAKKQGSSVLNILFRYTE